MPVTRDKVNFIEPMLLLASETLPEGGGRAYELRLDGYRALGIKNRRDRAPLAERQGFQPKLSGDRAQALADLPDETVIDGEVVALDEAGRPSFNALQNGAAGATIFFYVFDVMVLGGRNVIGDSKSVPRVQFFRGLHVEIAPKFSSQCINQPAGRGYRLQR